MLWKKVITSKMLTWVLTLCICFNVAASDDLIFSQTQRIIQEIQSHGKIYSNLKELVQFGHRLSGSEGAQNAIKWAKLKMEAFGADRVWMQPVQVPRWIRGKVERATILDRNSGFVSLQVTALGNSIGTQGAIEGQVIEVQSLQQVDKLGSALRGKIVFFNRAMDPSVSDLFDAYDATVDQRTSGASRAAQYGAKAVLVRSLTTSIDEYPHTGIVRYNPKAPKIPAAALSTQSANQLSKSLKENRALHLRLELSAKQLSQVLSFNVIGEIRGRELPDEYVVVGGHLDSWDLGVGAHDDGAGVVQTIEVIRALKTLGIQPKRTIRFVLFMAEEFGGIGGKEYANQAKIKGEKHIAALESDRGGFAPIGFAVENYPNILKQIEHWKKYLAPVGANRFMKGESGTDIEPLMNLGVIALGFIPVSQRYFDYHHSARDQLDAVNPSELNSGAASIAVFAYLLAEKELSKI